MQVWLLKRAFQSPRLMLTGAASLILLTPPAALAVVANMMANGGALAPFITAGPAELGRICQRMQGLRFLGMPLSFWSPIAPHCCDALGAKGSLALPCQCYHSENAWKCSMLEGVRAACRAGDANRDACV